MTENQNPQTNGHPLSTIDHAANALRQSRVPQGPPESLLLSTIARLNTESTLPASPQKRWFNRKTFTRYAIAASLLILVGLGLAWSLLGRGTTTAFADVLVQLQNITAVRCVLSVGPAGHDPMHVDVLMVEPGWVISTGKGVKSIVNTDKHQMVMLMQEPKQAVVIALKNTPALDPQHLNLLDQFKNVNARDSKPLGERDIDHHRTKGFEVVANGLDMKIWADTKTNLPVLIEAVGSTALLPADVTFSDFTWNPAYDAAELSLDVPAGYSAVSTNIDASAPVEQDIVILLKGFAEINHGVLPQSLDMKGLMSAIMDSKNGMTAGMDAKTPEERTKAQSQMMDKMMKIVVPIARGWRFMADPKNGSGWSFVPGAHLGDKNTPVLWYKTATTWRVINADLSIVNAAEPPQTGTPVKIAELMKIPLPTPLKP